MYSEANLKKIIAEIQSGELAGDDAYRRLKDLPYEDLGFAKIDHHRMLRKGLPEVIYSPGKTCEQMRVIIESLKAKGQPVLLTRLEETNYATLREAVPDLEYSAVGRIAFLNKAEIATDLKQIAVITAGTTDIPVAEEAALTLEVIGRKTLKHYDCGVAGLHRVLDKVPELESCSAVICIAGMDGALASVTAGLVSVPVIAVPTSVGYGAGAGGIAPLLTMLNSCSQGVAVVNIDSGFSAACFASLLK